ncbi:hypothetical protein ABIE33_002037 [Ensifer sp. 4252]
MAPLKTETLEVGERVLQYPFSPLAGRRWPAAG